MDKEFTYNETTIADILNCKISWIILYKFFTLLLESLLEQVLLHKCYLFPFDNDIRFKILFTFY